MRKKRIPKRKKVTRSKPAGKKHGAARKPQHNAASLEEQLTLGRKIMAEYRETFAALAKS